MGKKIFVTYKYGDQKVLNLPGNPVTRVRDYVSDLQARLSAGDHINKGENDGEDLSHFKDSTIASKLRDKIYDSSITIVVISKGMKEAYISEDEQWIPWEISYSLRESTREGRTSLTNAMLALVLPDEYGYYSYFMQYNPDCNSTTYNTDNLFRILKNNMFNQRHPNTRECNGSTIFNGYFSYIHCVKWDEFIKDIDHYINVAIKINENRNEYKITKEV